MSRYTCTTCQWQGNDPAYRFGFEVCPRCHRSDLAAKVYAVPKDHPKNPHDPKHYEPHVYEVEVCVACGEQMWEPFACRNCRGKQSATLEVVSRNICEGYRKLLQDIRDGIKQRNA